MRLPLEYQFCRIPYWSTSKVIGKCVIIHNKFMKWKEKDLSQESKSFTFSVSKTESV